MHLPLLPEKFRDHLVTLSGAPRAQVSLRKLSTLWFNTGTLCNIECAHCYIESSPTNRRLEYLELGDVTRFLDEIEAQSLPTDEIGFTGGEPFMNPSILEMLSEVLRRRRRALVLTNAMQPMLRPLVVQGLSALIAKHSERLTFRVSLDHYQRERHDSERGSGSFEKTLQGARWLSQRGARLHIAGRTLWNEDEASVRRGYAELFRTQDLAVNAHSREELVLFPEMDSRVDVPEITTACWGILGVDPNSMMCASSRMVVRRRGAATATVVACTLLPYDPRFELGLTLLESAKRVSLAHPHCAKFCVLGGGSCSA